VFRVENYFSRQTYNFAAVAVVTAWMPCFSPPEGSLTFVVKKLLQIPFCNAHKKRLPRTKFFAG
jgi:hypothetical protein